MLENGKHRKRIAVKRGRKNSVEHRTTKAKIANKAEMSYSHDRQIANQASKQAANQQAN